jgi:hypothetical protein
MKTLKSIDGKSLLIGGLLASTVFFAMGATSKTDAGKWDDKQVWEVKSYMSIGGGTAAQQKTNLKVSGYEPFALDDRGVTFVRRRTSSSSPPHIQLANGQPLAALAFF